jgi:hypothetical protein
MPFNETWNVTQPPFTNGIMTLTHDECMYVKTNCDEIITNYKPANYWDNQTPTDDQVISEYNGIDGWRKAINGDTYNCLKQYDPAIHTLGLDSSGIVQPAEEPVEEETPIEEV